MGEEQKTPEQLLRILLEHFSVKTSVGYNHGNLVWRYVEGCSIAEVESKDFEEELVDYLSKTEQEIYSKISVSFDKKEEECQK